MQVYIHIALKNETFIFCSYIAENLKKPISMIIHHHLELLKTSQVDTLVPRNTYITELRIHKTLQNSQCKRPQNLTSKKSSII